MSINTNAIKGLSSIEIEEKKLLGLSNSSIDTYSPSYFRIFARNFFTVMTIVLAPLIAAQYWFGLYRDAVVLTLFISVSSLINTIEEIRVKRRLDKLKTKFKNVATVIRDGEEKVVNAEEIVEGDYIIAKEGESIVTDGIIYKEDFLQVDESALTGESDYIEKNEKDKVLSGSYVVTGECVYIAKKVGKNNYLNKLGAESTKYRKKRSKLEKNGDTFIYIFTAMGLALTVLHYIVLTNAGYETIDIILGLTTILGITIPQTLLILLVLTFIVSVTKLARKGILVQKRGAIDDLSSVDTICIDKTGTITTNEMKIVDELSVNLNKELVGHMFHIAEDLLYGQNKTLKTLISYFGDLNYNSQPETFDQIPFTSKQKYSAFQINNKSIIIGAYSVISKYITPENRAQAEKFINKNEEIGRRLVTGVFFDGNVIDDLRNGKNIGETNKFFVVGIEEELNPGIIEVLDNLRKQGIAIKIISGDSKNYVEKIATKVGLDASSTVDLSEIDSVDFDDAVEKYTIFARSKPEDKAAIIKALQKKGKKVAMIGDGVNDVVGLKLATVGIAMETGSKVAREVSDIVLLKNDYKKIPEIFYEGDNIIFNLKLSTKIFFARSLMMVIVTLFFTFQKLPVPLSPTSTLIFSFLGSTLAGYILTFTRYNVKDRTDFLRDTIKSSFPAGIILGLSAVAVFLINEPFLNYDQANTSMVIGILGTLLTYTLYLLWDSNKIPKNIFIVGFGYIVTLLVGIFMTVLPLYAIKEPNEKLFTIGIVLTAAILIFLGLRLVDRFQNRAFKLSNYILPVAFVPFALLFPSRYYYGTHPVPFQYFGNIFIVVVIGAISVILVQKIISSTTNRKRV